MDLMANNRHLLEDVKNNEEQDNNSFEMKLAILMLLKSKYIIS